MTLRKFILIPPWILTLIAKPFLRRNHPWRECRCALAWWDAGATDLSLQFGVLMWLIGVPFGLTFLIVTIRALA